MAEPEKCPKSAPEGLRLLADWFDVRDAREGVSGCEVQMDLRRWAREFEETQSANAALRAENERLRAVQLAAERVVLDAAFDRDDEYGKGDHWDVTEFAMKELVAVVEAAKEAHGD